MKRFTTKITLTLSGLLWSFGLLAQSGSGSGSSILIYSLIGVAILLFFFILINVADNLLVIEAKSSGLPTDKASLGVIPRLREIFRPTSAPRYTEGHSVRHLQKGHDILLEGEAEAKWSTADGVTRFAVQPTNFRGLKPIPKMVVEVGQAVKAGEPLFYDKNMPEIQFVAPVSGEVIEINRGAKRAITEVVILADKEQQFLDLPAPNLDTATVDELADYLMKSGGWTLLRQRPYNVIPEPGDRPRDIFISTFDTAPLAPDLNFVVEGRGEAFQRGLDVLNKLTTGEVYLGLDARGDAAPAPVFLEAKGVNKQFFKGKHPAGNVGVQIHHIAPVGVNDKVWTLGVQEVIALGTLFLHNRFDGSRMVAITGDQVADPHYVRTHIGANLGELLRGQLANDKARIISGDVLSGEKKSTENYLNFYDDQITVIEEGDYFELFGWLTPFRSLPTISRTYPNFLFPSSRYKANTNTHGEKRAFVVTNDYEQVMPMDIYTQALMKAIIVNDFERMEGLGLLELVEEDVALCEFVCISKQPLQQILREGLEVMREQS